VRHKPGGRQQGLFCTVGRDTARSGKSTLHSCCHASTQHDAETLQAVASTHPRPVNACSRPPTCTVSRPRTLHAAPVCLPARRGRVAAGQPAVVGPGTLRCSGHTYGCGWQCSRRAGGGACSGVSRVAQAQMEPPGRNGGRQQVQKRACETGSGGGTRHVAGVAVCLTSTAGCAGRAVG
jgi:hypothetical protein